MSKKIVIDNLTDEQIIEFAKNYGFSMVININNHIGHAYTLVVEVNEENLKDLSYIFLTKKPNGYTETIHLSGS